jgi:hypothetical protein
MPRPVEGNQADAKVLQLSVRRPRPNPAARGAVQIEHGFAQRVATTLTASRRPSATFTLKVVTSAVHLSAERLLSPVVGHLDEQYQAA